MDSNWHGVDEKGMQGWLANTAALQAFTLEVPLFGHEVVVLPLGHRVLRNLEISLQKRGKMKNHR